MSTLKKNKLKKGKKKPWIFSDTAFYKLVNYLNEDEMNKNEDETCFV